MSNVQAKLASIVLIGVAANVGVIAAPGGAARAADSCITEPKDQTPQGRHWYYRIERGTGRHCWYLRGEDEAPARSPSAEPVAAARPAPQTAGNAPARSLADARAEFAPRARIEDGGNTAAPAPSVWPDPPAPAAVTTGIGPGAPAFPPPVGSEVTSRWPQASGTPSTANATPDASLMVADAQADEMATAAPAPAAAQQASPPSMREVGSLQKLVLVAFGALALAGIAGSLVYRLAGGRSRRRQERWPQRQPASASLAEQARSAPWVAPELSPTVPHTDPASDGRESRDGQERVEGRVEERTEDSFEKIEDFLARLTKQLQDELQSTRSTELENPRPH